MENASKALIIAGAILISILIIGLGVTIYNNSVGNVNSANLDKETIMAQNSQFESYFGKKVSGSQVKALYSLVRTNNAVATRQGDDEKKVTMNPETENVQTSKYYTVDVDDSTKNGYWPTGYIKTIKVTENNK